MLTAFGLIAGYAASRAIVGPSDLERAYALARETTAVVPAVHGDIFRNVGSFSSAVGLVSFLVPAGVFALAVAVFTPRYRILGSVIFGAVLVAIAGSYVRIAFLALVIGVIVVGLAAVRWGKMPLARKRFAVAAAVAAVLAGTIATAVASGASQETRERALGIVQPLTDESMQTRLKTWKASSTQIRKHPLGTGVGTVGGATTRSGGPAVTADSSYLKILQEQGLVLGGLFLFSLASMCVAIFRHVADATEGRQELAIAAMGGFVAFLALASIGEYVEQPGKVLAWMLLGVGAAQTWARPTAGVP
jgi:hypothetical protein